jgi:hypothetical protein
LPSPALQRYASAVETALFGHFGMGGHFFLSKYRNPCQTELLNVKFILDRRFKDEWIEVIPDELIAWVVLTSDRLRMGRR